MGQITGAGPEVSRGGRRWDSFFLLELCGISAIREVG
jgi:hypothetical protein